MAKGKTLGINAKGKEIQAFSLKNKNGIELTILNIGGAVQSFKVPDKNGNLVDIVFGYENWKGYEANPSYMGVIVSRLVNRLSNGKVKISGKEYILQIDEDGLHMHSGGRGTFNQVFELIDYAPSKLTLKTTMKNLQDDLPGNMDIFVQYELTEDNKFVINYKAATDETTIFMPTYHGYFNLSGHQAKDLKNHMLQINADYYMVHDEVGLPTGEIKKVEKTAFDFKKPASVYDRLTGNYPELKTRNGYDNSFMLNDTGERHVATVSNTENGIYMECYTDQPVLQIYTSGYLEGVIGKDDNEYAKNSAICLETQHAPNSPNQPWLKSIELRPEETYQSTTTYKIGVNS